MSDALSLKARHSRRLWSALAVALLLSSFGGLIGEVWLSPERIVSSLQGLTEPWIGYVVLQLRLPRTTIAFLVGTALSLAGVTLQARLRNPLAEPSILGTTGGAVLGTVLVLYASLGRHWLPFGAWAGAMLSLAAVTAMARSGSGERWILSGVAVSSLMSSAAMLVLSLSVANWELGREIVRWMLGGMEGRNWTDVLVVAVPTAVCFGWAMKVHRSLDFLSLGDEHAQSFGVDPQRAQNMIALVVGLLSACTVSTVGTVGFVGLIGPHLGRMLVGATHRKLIPMSMLLGGILVTAADLICRLTAEWVELRPGVLTSLLGGPFFIALLMSKRSRAHG